MIVFGGQDGRTRYADVHSFCFLTNEWTPLQTRGVLVKPRFRHSAVMYKNCMYVFGGESGGEGGVCYNDFYEFNVGKYACFLTCGSIDDVDTIRNQHMERS